MGKKKFGTLIDPDYLTDLKIIAAREGKRLSQVLEEAVAQYLVGKGGSVVDRTRGALPAPVVLVQAVLGEEDADDADDA